MSWLLWVVLAVYVAPVWAECWTRNDGVEICSEEPVEWIVLWWIWLGLLLIAGMLIQYCDCCGSSTRRAVDNEPADPFHEPLPVHGDHTNHDHGENKVKPGRVQPVYRYLE